MVTDVYYNKHKIVFTDSIREAAKKSFFFNGSAIKIKAFGPRIKVF